MTAQSIRQLNNEFRQTLIGGRVFLTPGVQALEPIVRKRLLSCISQFEVERDGNDPYGEADFGKVVIHGDDYFWKIDYYDHALQLQLQRDTASLRPINT